MDYDEIDDMDDTEDTVTQTLVKEALSMTVPTVIPFDCQNVLANNIFVYGETGDGNLIGHLAFHNGGTVYCVDGDSLEIPSGIGLVIGNNHGRVLLRLVEHLYLGWLDERDVEIIHPHSIHVPEGAVWLN